MYVIVCIIIDSAGPLSALEKWSDHGMLKTFSLSAEGWTEERETARERRLGILPPAHFAMNSEHL